MRVLAVTNLYPSARHPTLGTFVEQQIVGLKRIGLEVEVIFVNRGERGMGSYITLGAPLRKRIEQFQPDVVHVMYGGILAERVTSIVTEKPVVVSFCGSDLLGERLLGPFRGVIGECGVFASHIAAKRAVGIIVKSRNLEEALPVSVDRSKVRIIPNGIDLERFRPLDRIECRKKLGWNLDRFHVLFPANAGLPIKQPHLAQAAVDAANRLGLNAEMHHLRGVPHEEVAIWLNASDVVLLTSLHEGSPNIIKEALACNVPVVSLDVGDVRERISNIEGCYIAASDSLDLGAKLCMVRGRDGRIAGREMMQCLSLEQTCLKLRSFYLEVAESYHGRMAKNFVEIWPNALVEFSASVIARHRSFRRR